MLGPRPASPQLSPHQGDTRIALHRWEASMRTTTDLGGITTRSCRGSQSPDRKCRKNPAESARLRYSTRGYRRRMGFTMAPAFFSTDLDRTSKFWGALGFTEAARYEGY